MNFEDVLKELRTKRKISQAKLADDLNLSPGLIGMYENGTRKPSYENLEAIADYFNVSLDYLTGKDDKSIYYLDPEVAEMANALKNNPGQRVLFDAAKDLPPEDMLKVLDFISQQNKKEGREN